ncbi:MAG TPA: type VI secretion system-associated protein TagF [candidate division Zixibacteria bacterium]|nr:type VI secretion system-associated protein TagF [candidate division Zixibacteria bacterium]
MNWNSKPEEAQTPIGYTGKLPAFGDFVRANVSSPAARVLEKWLSDGLAQFPAKVGNGWEKSFDSGQSFSFVINPGEPAGVLVGLSTPSRDRGGRRFPFSLFSTAQSGPEGEFFYLLPVAFGPFLERGQEAVAEAWPSSVDAIYRAKVSLLASSLPRYLKDGQEIFDRYLESQTLGDFWQKLFGSFEAAEKYLLLDNLFKSLIPLRRQEFGRFNFILQFPVRGSSTQEAGRQAAFWIFLCQKILARPRLPLQAFWNFSSEAGASCFLFFRLPEAALFPYLLVPGLDNHFIWNLAALGREKLQKERLPAALVKVLDNPDEQLKSLLNLKDWEKHYGG